MPVCKDSLKNKPQNKPAIRFTTAAMRDWEKLAAALEIIKKDDF